VRNGEPACGKISEILGIFSGSFSLYDRIKKTEPTADRGLEIVIPGEGRAVRPGRLTWLSTLHARKAATLYTTKVLTEMLGVKFGELRALFKQELGAERARNLKEQMLAAGLPV